MRRRDERDRVLKINIKQMDSIYRYSLYSYIYPRKFLFLRGKLKARYARVARKWNEPVDDSSG